MLRLAASGSTFARECQTWNSSVPTWPSHSNVGRLFASRYSCFSSLCPENTLIVLDELRQRLLPVFLEEPLAVDTLGHADHRQRPVAQVRQHVRRDAGEIADQVALRDAGALGAHRPASTRDPDW